MAFTAAYRQFWRVMLIISIVAAVILIAVDQIIKYWAVKELMPVGNMEFIKLGDTKILDLTYVENDGAAFSSFSGAKYFLIVLTTVMIVALIIYAIRDKKKQPFMMLSIFSVVAGGAANLIDRIRLGYVIDYLNVKLFKFAVFNFADICVVLGAICILIYIIISEKKETVKK